MTTAPPTTGAVPLSPLHRAWRRLPAGLRRAALTRVTAWLTTLPDAVARAVPDGIAIAGEFSSPSGLGEGARITAAAARSLGVRVWTIDLVPPLFAEAAVAIPPGVPLVVVLNPPLLPLALLRTLRAVARERRIIGYWAWELPDAPPHWAAATRLVHEIWVPSAFTAAAIGPLSTRRIRVVPAPLGASPPRPAALPRAAFGLPEDAVVVLVSFNLASSLVRKNPFAAIAAFKDAFGTRPDRLLLLKIGNPDHAPADMAAIVEAAAAPNIRIETRMMPSDERHALTAASDIVVSLHRSEGLGLVPAEAMLLGKPVVATGWSGNMTFMDRASAALVGYRLVPACDPRGVYGEGLWAEPDHADAVAALRRLADDPALRQALGRRGRLAARQRLGMGPLMAALSGLGLSPQPV